MARPERTAKPAGGILEKCPTGIHGFDEITGGGLPKGRPSLVCGSAGCGKTVFAAEFLARGAAEFDEPGVFVTFEETGEELARNFASMGIDFAALVARKKLAVDYVYIERNEIEETGDYNLEGLFVRLQYAIDSVGAKRVALDTIEALFSGLGDTSILRAELRRLFRWLKDKGVTTVITGERGEGTLTRYGIEEYVADCVILLDHRVTDQISTRRMRIVKYRGSSHGMNEYPFLITEKGISLLPITSVDLDYAVSRRFVSSGIAALDAMLGGRGYREGSNILISGNAGTGKTSFAATFAETVCRDGKKCLYFAMEESPQQVVRNMRSIGIDFEPFMKKGLLEVHAARPTVTGLEMHLVVMHRLINEHQPDVVIIDPLSDLAGAGLASDVKLMLVRVLDFLKNKGVTSLFTDLALPGDRESNNTAAGVSSLMDTWVVLSDSERDGEFVRKVRVIKSRGMANSNLSCGFRMSGKGIEIVRAVKDKNTVFARKPGNCLIQ